MILLCWWLNFFFTSQLLYFVVLINLHCQLAKFDENSFVSFLCTMKNKKIKNIKLYK